MVLQINGAKKRKQIMTRIIACAVFMLSLTGIAFAGAHEDADVGADIAKAQPCIECHESMGMSLKNEGADAIAAKITAISGGESSHPPVLQGASDADIAEVAKLLNERG